MKWFVDFSGWCTIEADTPEEAKEKFWEYIERDEPIPSNIYEVTGVEEKRYED